MTEQGMREWISLFLLRESFAPEDPKRDDVDDTLDDFWFSAKPADRLRMQRFLVGLDKAIDEALEGLTKGLISRLTPEVQVQQERRDDTP